MLLPVNRVEPACLTFASVQVSSIECECPSEVQVCSLYPYFRVEAVKQLFCQQYMLISFILKLSKHIGVFAFRYMPCNDCEYWKLGKCCIGLSTVKLNDSSCTHKSLTVLDLENLQRLMLVAQS
jgi:hypothetical protein